MAEPVTQTPRSASLRAQLQVDDPYSPANAMRSIAQAWANWRAQQVPQMPSKAMRFDALGREQPIVSTNPEDYRGADAIQSGGMVRPLQAVKAIRSSGNTPETVSKHAGRIFQNRRQLEKDWADVGGKGPTDVTYKGRGAEMLALKVKPKSGEPTEILKMPHSGPETFSIDPDIIAQPYVIPTRWGGGQGAPYAWVAQPEARETRAVARMAQENPGLLGFDPKEAVKAMLRQINQSPRTFFDRGHYNIGFLGNEAKVIDVGSVGHRYRGLNEQRGSLEAQARQLLGEPAANWATLPPSAPTPPSATPPPPPTPSPLPWWMQR